MIKATIQNNPYCTEMNFPCTETELSEKLGEIGIDKEHLAPTGMVIDIEPAELSVLTDCEVNMVANQDTLIDGNFTTDTIIYWLWSNGTTDYTYDPDGDEITGRFLGGINEYVLGNVTIGDKIVGFATKFDVAVQHELIYYVQDENGAYSNILRYAFSVEPADGNKYAVSSVH